MGYSLAENAAAFGADVTLVHGPVRLADIPGVEIIGVDNLRDAVKVVFGSNRVNHDDQVYPDE